MNKKVGLFLDELWSYSLSNAINNRPIYDKVFNYNHEYLYNKWISGLYFFNLLTIQEEEKFNYSKVKQNMSLDTHPPFYKYLIHTICSFFPNSFSKWYGFSLNLVIFVFAQIIFFIICRKFFSNKISLLILFYYGFTSAAINTFINIRMYALLTFFFLLISLIFIKTFDSKNIKLTFICVFITVFLGSYTHYHFMVYCFYLTVIFDIICLFQKKYKTLCSFSFGALIGVSLVYFLFPAMKSHLLASPRGLEAANHFNLLNILLFWNKEFFSILLCHLLGLNKTSSNVLVLPFNIAFLFIFYIISSSLILRLLWKKINITNNIILKSINIVSNYLVNNYNSNYKFYSILLALYLFISTIAPTINYDSMYIYSMRYFTPVYPFIAIIIVLLVIKILSLKYFNKHKKLFVVTILIIFGISGQIFNLVYLFPEKNNTYVQSYRSKYTSLLSKTDIIINANDENKILDLSLILKNSNRCYIYKDLKNLTNMLNTLDFNNKNYLIIPYSLSIPSNLFEKKRIEIIHLNYISNFWVYELFEIKKTN